MSALPQSQTQIELNKMVAAICTEIERANEVDDNLLDGYKVWFDKQNFETLHLWLQRILRRQLKDRGIILGHLDLKTITILVELLTMFEVPEWPDLVLTKWDNSLNLETRAYKKMVESRASAQLQQEDKINCDPNSIAHKRNVIVMQMSTQESIISDKKNTNSSLNVPNTQYVRNSYTTKNSLTGDEYVIPIVAEDVPSKSGNIRAPELQQQFEYAQYYEEDFDEGLYKQLPPVDVPNERADPRLTTNFTKLIQNGDKFETVTQRDNYCNEWNLINFEEIKRENPDKTPEEAIDVMLDKMQKCRKALGHEYQGDAIFLEKLMTAIKGSSELAGVLEKNPHTSKEIIDYSRMANRAYKAKQPITTGQYIIDNDEDNNDETMYTDRNYSNNKYGFRGKQRYSGINRFSYRGNMRKR
ncbi:hypothetical protein GcC1_053038, partial [Golovinomyces cichoracearum]